MKQHKLLFTGTVGAGKTTAIAAVSEIPPITTDVGNHDPLFAKALTTVALDYGELTLANGDVLRLYGTPGQERFSFMWKILARGALGLIVLIDNSRPDPLADLDDYLSGFADLIARTACVVAVGRMDSHPNPDLDQFAGRLASRGVLCPVLPVDVRQPDEVVQLLDLLLTQLEARSN
jgi:hypothetical protein